MNCQSVRDLLPDLLDNRTAATTHLEARAHLARCPDCQREFAELSQAAQALDAIPTPVPSPQLRTNFYTMLEAEKQAGVATSRREPRARRRLHWGWILSPLAACALVALGFALGHRATPAVSRGEPSAESIAMQAELKKLRADVNKMTTAVAYTLFQQQQGPANERLREILVAAKAENPSDKILDDLVLALTLDPSANVRLRAIEALYPHAERELVRASVLAALPREQNPLVQIELIDFVAAAQDPNAAPVLAKMADDEAINTSVRDAAKMALAQL